MILRRAAAVGALVISTFVVPVAHATTCADGGGVTVVVDYRALGAGVQTGCAEGGQASGLTALAGAGFGYAFPSRQPGFVCRINGLPAEDRETCFNTPPGDAYWSYWHAEPGGSWSYSSFGAAGYEPPAGSVEGWAFGAGEQPGISPPQRPAPPPVQPLPPPQVNPPPPEPPPGRTTATTSESPAGTTTSVPTTGLSVTSSPASPVPMADAKQSVGVEPAGSSAGLITASTVIALLGGAALWTARRRARARE